MKQGENVQKSQDHESAFPTPKVAVLPFLESGLILGLS